MTTSVIDEVAATNLYGGAKEHLRAFVERIERLNAEKDALTTDIFEVYAEAKGNGFDTKAIRKIVSLRKKAEHQRLEEDALLATYMHALGMIPSALPDEDRKRIGHNSNGADTAAE